MHHRFRTQLVALTAVLGSLSWPATTHTLPAASSNEPAIGAVAAQGSPAPTVKGPIKTAIIPDPAPPPAAPSPQTGAKPVSAGAGAKFRDDFDQPKLGTAWKVVQEDPERWTVERGLLVIATQAGTAAAVAEKEDVKNRIVLDRDLPANYTINARMNMTIYRAGGWGGLRIRTPGGSYVALGHHGLLDGFRNGYRRPFLEKVIGADQSRIVAQERFWDGGKPTQVDLDAFTRRADSLWLRLEKKGSTFTGSFSFDGTRFERIGDQVLVRTEGSRLELIAFDDSKGIETSAEFDFVEVIP